MKSMREQIQALENTARALDPAIETRNELLEYVNNYTNDFLESLPDRLAYVESEDKAIALYDSPIREEGKNIESVIQLFKDNVDTQGLNAASGGHMAYIPACSMYYSALADYIVGVVNRFSGDFSTSPGAVRMENQVLRWIADLVGYPDGAAGNLLSGGSIATLTAMVTARESHGLRANDYQRAVVYTTQHTHHCAHKALHIAGMGECVIRAVATDETYHMLPANLEELIQEDKNNKLIPWMVIGSAGTTNVGSVDDLYALHEIAKRHELWYHVDAAYGGFFLLSSLVKEKFHGIEYSDSVIMDPHKGMFLPFGTGAVIVRDREKLYKAHFHTADYLQDSLTGSDELSPADLGPELSRHFRAMRLWLPLQVAGVAPFRAALDEKILLARYAYDKLKTLDRFELGPYPDLSIFFFRYLPENGDADLFNKRLLEELRQDGRYFLSSTLIDNNYVIRFAILSMRTHLNTIDGLLDLIVQLVEKLNKS